MPKLNLKPNHKAIRDYYTTLQQYEKHAITHEGAVSSPFDTLLQTCAKQVNATLVPQYTMHTSKGRQTERYSERSEPSRCTTVYRGFDWACYHRQSPDDGDCEQFAAIVTRNRQVRFPI